MSGCEAGPVKFNPRTFIFTSFSSNICFPLNCALSFDLGFLHKIMDVKVVINICSFPLVLQLEVFVLKVNPKCDTFFFVKLRLCLDYATEGRYLKAKLNQKIKKWGSLETYELINAKIINLIIFILSENPLDVDPFRPISTQTTSTAGGERWSRKALVSRKGSAGVSVCVCVCEYESVSSPESSVAPM